MRILKYAAIIAGAAIGSQTSAQLCDGSGLTGVALVPSTETDQWAAPSNYYRNVAGTGAALRTSLQSAMSAGHIQRRYGDFRYSAALHDADPNNASRILLVYNVASVSGTWNSGATWNREHVWPQSLQPGSASNSTRGNLGDPHALRPCNPSINSSRSNKPFGSVGVTGGYRSLGSYYFPGDIDKGSIARSLFYSSVRYGLELVNGFPSGNQMGDLAALLDFHYAVKPSEFERRRNHVIFSQSLNPSYYTNNRNAFVDLPGTAWSVFVDNFNDSRLWIGDTPNPDGGSTFEGCQRIIHGGTLQGAQITLNRDGTDGVYYAIVPSGDVITDQPLTNGFTDTFAIGDTAPRSFVVGIDPSAVTGPGIYSGTVTIDNLDMTTGLGTGFGANDADDVVTLTAEVLAPSAASFTTPSVVTSLQIDAGTLSTGISTEIQVPIYVIETVFGATAGVELSAASGSGDTSEVSLVLPAGVVQAGGSGTGTVVITPSDAGPINASYTISVHDDTGIVGATSRTDLTLSVVADASSPCPGDIDNDGQASVGDVLTFLALWQLEDPPADRNNDGVFTVGDVLDFLAAWSSGCDQ